MSNENAEVVKKVKKIKTKKEPSKYQDLLDIHTQSPSQRYEDIVFIDDKTKSVISTNAISLYARRDVYDELKVVSRLADTHVLEFDKKNQVFQKTERLKDMVLDVQGVIPSKQDLLSKNRAVRLTVPEWISHISSKAKGSYVSLVMGDEPVLTLGESSGISYMFNVKMLAPFAGKEIDIYCPTEKGPYCQFLIMDAGSDLDTAKSFTIVMGGKSSGTVLAQYADKK